MLLCDPDIVEAVREGSLEAVEARAAWHGRGDRNDARILRGETDQRLRENAGVGGRTRLLGGHPARFDFESADAVICKGVSLRRLVAVTLGRDRVHEDRPIAVGDHLLHVLERLEQHVDPVSLDRPHVLEVQRFEE